MTEIRTNIAIIGAGAAGLFAAATALKKGAKITLFERNATPGQKLNLTGNGKCNFSNIDLDPVHFYPSEYVYPFLKHFDTNEINNIFASFGVLSYTDKNGGLYPASQKASTVTDALIQFITMNGGVLQCNSCVTGIEKTASDTFKIFTDNCPYSELFDSIILCCGGKASPKTGSDGFGYRLARSFGHTVTRTYPVLVQLRSDSNLCRTCAGVRVKANATAYINEKYINCESGELQITDYGLSGIMIFNLSRDLTRAVEEGDNCRILVDFLPSLSLAEIPSFTQKRLQNIPSDSVIHILEGVTNSKLADAVLKARNISPSLEITAANKNVIDSLLAELKVWSFRITSHNGYGNAQATRGGVSTSELTDELESRLVSGIYFAGEMINVDGDCGGYNLHWAWTSASIAAESAVTKGKRHDTNQSV